MAKAAKKKPADSQSEADFTPDELVQAMKEFNTEDSERASDAGESRQRIGAYLEKTKLNNKAFAFFRGLLRAKKETTRRDILRSVELILPAIKAEIIATTTTDAFDTPLAAIKAAEAEKAAASNVIRPWGDMTAAEQQASVAQFEGDGLAKPSFEPDPDFADFDADVAAFDQAASETLGE